MRITDLDELYTRKDVEKLVMEPLFHDIIRVAQSKFDKFDKFKIEFKLTPVEKKKDKFDYE